VTPGTKSGVNLVQTCFIEQGGLWENGYNESFNGKFRDEPLNVLYLEGGPGTDSGMKAGIQYVQAAQFVEVSFPGTSGMAALKTRKMAEL
jgi:hypothetical protein